MQEENNRIPDGPASPCGHGNPPSALFCDVCGVRLPTRCPRCDAINRSLANFCNHCGISLRETLRTQAASSIVPLGPSPETSPATKSESGPPPPGTNRGTDWIRRSVDGAEWPGRAAGRRAPRAGEAILRATSTCVGMAGDRQREHRARVPRHRPRPHSHRDVARRAAVPRHWPTGIDPQPS